MQDWIAYHLGRFSACNAELHIGILLPVPKQQREFGQKAIKNAPCQGNRLRRTVPVQATLEGFGDPDQLLPALEVVRIVDHGAVRLLKLDKLGLHLLARDSVIRHLDTLDMENSGLALYENEVFARIKAQQR